MRHRKWRQGIAVDGLICDFAIRRSNGCSNQLPVSPKSLANGILPSALTSGKTPLGDALSAPSCASCRRRPDS